MHKLYICELRPLLHNSYNHVMVVLGGILYWVNGKCTCVSFMLIFL